MITPQDIDALTAGPGLDRLVAEHITHEDLTPITRDSHYFNIDTHTYPEYPCHFCGLPEARRDENIPCVEVPEPLSYSTDIAAAWKVFDKFLAFEMNYKPAILNKGVDKYEVTLIAKKFVIPPIQITATATTAPLAICKATLKAVMGSEG